MTSFCLILLLWAIVYGAIGWTYSEIQLLSKCPHRAVTARIQTILEAIQGLYEARVTAMRMNAIVYFWAIIPLLSELHGRPICSHSEG
jgi:hypothetical protein